MLYTDICLGIFVVIGSSISTTKDSLLNIIGSPVEFSLQIEIYRGLADFYFEKPEEVDYLNKMYFTAKAVNDKTHMFETLSDLVFSYIKVYHADSVWYYMSLLKDVGTLEESHPYLFFLRSPEGIYCAVFSLSRSIRSGASILRIRIENCPIRLQSA